MTNLTTLTNEQLEVVANDCLLADDFEAEEACLLEMIRRDHYPVEWLDELLELAN